MTRLIVRWLIQLDSVIPCMYAHCSLHVVRSETRVVSRRKRISVKDHLFNAHDASLNASSDLASEEKWQKKKRKIERVTRKLVERGKRSWVCLLRSLRADATGKTRKRTRVNDRAEKPTLPPCRAMRVFYSLMLANHSSLLGTARRTLTLE